MTRMHLIVGGLNRESLAELPHLARLMARGRSGTSPVDAGISATLARLFGVEQRDLAAIALAAEDADPGADCWFHADPVHLLAGMHSLTLFDGRQFQIQDDESAALLATLNRHFDGEIEFLAPHPARWYARFKRTPEVDMPPLDQVAGSVVSPGLIAGPDAQELQRTSTEIQMLLYTHPVNEAREERNEATVNGLWFWGGGRYRQPAPQFDQVMADDFHARALAEAASIRSMPLPAGLDRLPEGRTLAVLDRRHVEQHDEDWFAPILRGLQRGRLDEVELTLAGHPATRHGIDRWRSLRFWLNR
ncbi:MAG: hypothetical protein PHX10_14235 [Gallionellaceae bacterium]|nr:hypothetical protein [Gallionellaceae bacterium]